MTNLTPAAAEARARRIGANMSKLEELTDAETYRAVTQQIVAEAEKAPNAQGRMVFTEQGMADLDRELDKAVMEFEPEGYDDSIERAERAAGA